MALNNVSVHWVTLANAAGISITTNSSWTYFLQVLLKTCNCSVRNFYWYLTTSASDRHPLTCIMRCYCKAFAVYWCVSFLGNPTWFSSDLISFLWSNSHQWLTPIRNFSCGYSDLFQECSRPKNLLATWGNDSQEHLILNSSVMFYHSFCA